jgi:hypothetical protein
MVLSTQSTIGQNPLAKELPTQCLSREGCEDGDARASFLTLPSFA